MENLNQLIENFKIKSLKLKDFADINENNFSTISEDLISMLNILNLKTSQKLTLKLSFIDNFIKAIDNNHPKCDMVYQYLIFNKILEILKVNDKPIIFITLLKNSLNTEPNYNIVQKLKTQKGYQIHKILSLLFSNGDDMLEFVKFQQIVIQSGIDFKNLIIGIIKTIAMDILYYISINTNQITLLNSIFSMKYFKVEFGDFEEYIDYYCELFYNNIGAKSNLS